MVVAEVQMSLTFRKAFKLGSVRFNLPKTRCRRQHWRQVLAAGPIRNGTSYRDNAHSFPDRDSAGVSDDTPGRARALDEACCWIAGAETALLVRCAEVLAFSHDLGQDEATVDRG